MGWDWMGSLCGAIVLAPLCGANKYYDHDDGQSPLSTVAAANWYTPVPSECYTLPRS